MPTSLPARLRRIENLPVLLLILVNIIIGTFTYKDYGFSLDEPLFYGYADAIGYAYSPANWFQPDFDLGKAYGPSPWDHKNRGPAYLLLARGPAHLLQAAGLDQASAWHLVNFLAFQVGIYFLYVFARRWMNSWGAFFATALFSTQPVIWEHAFINPKDPPFLAFFLISLELGFRMADYLATAPADEKPSRIVSHVLLPGILLGLTTGIRILGPFAGLLVILYFLLLKKPARLLWLLPYGLTAILVMFISWPFLWESPFSNFLGTLAFMADNPTELRVLFFGQVYRADALPIRYLPVMLLLTLTEPVWPLAILGSMAAVLRLRRRELEWRSLLATLLWFVVPMLYVLVFRPPLYDSFRHFMFIIPPVFVLGGLAMQELFRFLRASWMRAGTILLLLLPGMIAAVQLHPYQYAYYNQFIGGTAGAAGRFETDYWQTCYKEAIEQINLNRHFQPIVFVRREGYIAQYYAMEGVTVIDGGFVNQKPKYGDFILEGSRANPSLQRYVDSHNAIVIKRQRAAFCMIYLNTP